MQLSYHGGLCCGVMSLHGFGDPAGQTPIFDRVKQCWNKPEHELTDEEQFDNIIKNYRGANILLEVVLTDSQLEMYEECWRGKLDAAGFVLVTRCYNQNSGRHINIFHRHPNRKG